MTGAGSRLSGWANTENQQKHGAVFFSPRTLAAGDGTHNGLRDGGENMKSTQTTVKQRVEEVLEIRLMGARWRTVCVMLRPRAGTAANDELWNYVHKGDEILAKTLEHRPNQAGQWTHGRTSRAVRPACMAVSDYCNTRGVLKDKAELLGLYQGNGDGLPPPAEPEPDWTPAERAREMIQLCPGTPGAGSGVRPGVSSTTVSRPPRPRMETPKVRPLTRQSFH